MITTLRRSTIALLASSLLLTIGRGATLPFMTIYLTRRFQLAVDVICLLYNSPSPRDISGSRMP
ncbi:hypothetical protein CWN17_20720, partial [Klebsiella pneumoniae]